MRVDYNALRRETSRWIGVVQTTLGRQADSPPDDFFAEPAIRGVQEAYRSIRFNPEDLIRRATNEFAYWVRNDLYDPERPWSNPYFNSHIDFAAFPEEEKVRYTALAIAGAIPLNRASHFNEGCYEYPLRDGEKARFENIAVNVLKRVWANRPLGKDKELSWLDTVIAVGDSVHTLAADEVIQSLDNLSQEEFNALCQRTHEIMVARGLWGKDNTNPDRAYPNGIPKPFNELSQNMKGNYVLIVLSYLVARSYSDNKGKAGLASAA